MDDTSNGDGGIGSANNDPGGFDGMSQADMDKGALAGVAEIGSALGVANAATDLGMAASGFGMIGGAMAFGMAVGDISQQAVGATLSNDPDVAAQQLGAFGAYGASMSPQDFGLTAEPDGSYQWAGGVVGGGSSLYFTNDIYVFQQSPYGGGGDGSGQ